MRATDFITERDIKVEIPINITIPQDGGDPKVSVADNDKSPGDESEAEKVMVSPLQQEVELAKAAQGKESPVIDELTDDDEEVGAEDDVNEETDELAQFKALLDELK
tara:strand:+ start:488 stop:808 length:321 start_codon:yes stop_codon:yes gene_type:complete